MIGAGLSRNRATQVFGQKLSKRKWKSTKVLNTKLKPKTRGRPKGSAKYSDADIVKAIRPHAQTSAMHKADGTLKQTVPVSWRRLFHKSNTVRQSCGTVRTLQRRTRRCRLGFSRAHKRTDICAECHHYDAQVEPKFKGDLKEIIDTLNKCHANYFNEWVDDLDWTEADFEPCESPSYVAAMKDYIDARPTSAAHARTGLTENELKELVDAEVERITTCK